MQETWETSPRETPRLGKIFWRRAENPVQYSCLKNPMDRGAWYISVHRATQVGYDWSNLAHFYQRHQRSSVQFSLSFMFDCLWTHGLQYARLLCPSPTSWSLFNSNSNSCPSSQWCHPTISSSVVPFSSRLQSFPASVSFFFFNSLFLLEHSWFTMPASVSFQMSHFFTSGGQSIEVSVSASVLPMNKQDWFSIEWIGWISLQSKGF